MTHATFRRSLRAFCRRTPFRPFVIQFVTGEDLTSGHPEAVMLYKRVAIATEPDRRQRLFDSYSVCQLLEVSEPVPLKGRKTK
jgi:hypothetical protein